MNKILIIGPSWVGDTVMAQTLFRLLKRNKPTTLLDVLAPPALYPLLERMPEVHQAIGLPLKHGDLHLRRRYQIAKQLRSVNYSQVIVLPNSFKSALIPFWAKIPHRTGWLGEYRWGLLNDVRYLDKQKYPLMIERFAALALPQQEPLPTDIPWPALHVSTESVTATSAKYLIQSDKPVLALCPGAEYGPSKRWPTEYYAQVATEKLADGWQVWLLGGPNERFLANEIQQSAQQRCIDLTGKTTLGEVIDLLSATDAVVSNDSGLMHIAAALQRPLVAIYGSSAPHFTPPLSDKAKIVSLELECSPCFKRTCPLEHWRCMRDLLPGRVLNILNELLPS